jgi:hypothetical protein
MGVLASCPEELPDFYDDETGLVGVETQEGSLAGSWALVIEFAHIVSIPIIGDRNGGSQGLRLVKRTWDADAKVYKDEGWWCHNEVFEVEGAKSEMSPDLYPKLGPINITTRVDHATGDMWTDTVVNLWGVQNLPDAEETELPTHENYETPPQSDWIFDEDVDGNPGVTVHLSGVVDADAYLCTRSVFHLEGTVIAQDRVQGLARSKKTNQHTVKATSPLVVGETKTRPDPNAKASWFDMVLLEDGATCDDVLSAQQGGRLASRRPF